MTADELEPWPLNGYAPGGYHCKCHECGKLFEGDKRAVTCLLCAVVLSKRAARNRPSEAVADALQDSAYLAGAKAGWNAAQADDPNAAFEQIVKSRKGYLKPIKDAQAARRTDNPTPLAALRGLANAFSIFTVEDDDGIRFSTNGKVVAHYGAHSPEGIALLKLEAAHRHARAVLSRAES